MSHTMIGHVSRIKTLVIQQSDDINLFLIMRCMDLRLRGFNDTPDTLKPLYFGYIEWCAMASEAAVANLTKRKWKRLASFFEQLVLDAFEEAQKTPDSGNEEIWFPTLLSKAYIQNYYLNAFNEPGTALGILNLERVTRLVEIDPSTVQTGTHLLGEAAVREITRPLLIMCAIKLSELLVSDLSSAGEDSKKVAPEKIPTLSAVISGGRDLSASEQRLVGKWVYEEFYSSGGFSARTELHMILLNNGLCVRSSKAVASSAFRDSAGNWTGSMDAMSGLAPSERGKWQFDGRLLTLEMDDDRVYEYAVTLSGTSMMTRNTSGGDQRLWTKYR